MKEAVSFKNQVHINNMVSIITSKSVGVSLLDSISVYSASNLNLVYRPGM